ncbi:EIN3-binding F-box protein 2 [Hibiscus syriacus]|uniref:EIN3-binding F-box protein 2 n=1 Tax=Hibiscus syriacus TaxID=106335 RepID=A0A6A3A739_HIBSY|nr:EIN3-binding F-box protein 1-like [Hibiscus syriacus]XP_039009908.1 EIN3-binding F-box protein 1-like isoform X1 [Hibiscus syriacus]KAE8700190.1 EIN3-binding F-box protein 2 [Hibiscus syriacus]KAE8736078.1 EIN3-binding F-box protein 2 [Hibiscus syriacus]
MPALVNYGDDDDFYSGGSFYTKSSDLGRLCSISSQLDVYYPPHKRARIGAPFLFGETEVEHNKQPSIDVLPDECLFEIFKRIPGGRERSSCACASKHWLMLMTSIRKGEYESSKVVKENISSSSDDVETISSGEADGYLSRCLEGKKATDMRLAAAAVGASGHGGLGKLSIRGSSSSCGVTNFGLSAIARGCPSLKVLCLWNVPHVGDDGLSEIAKECHSLEKLDLCQCPSVSNKGLIAIAENCPNLTALSIESCPKIGNEGLHAIGKLCPQLHAISIKDCPLVGDHGVSSLLSSSSSVLSKVKLQGLSITDFSLAVIGHYGKSVTNLVLSGLQNETEKGFWVMGNAQGLQKLVSLMITSCCGVTDVSLEAIGKVCINLKQMCLRRCFFVSGDGLVAFAKSAGSLECLQLEECNRVTQAGIIGVLSNCGLKSLTIVRCMGFKDISLGAPLSSPCNSLKSLSIRNCPGFGTVSLALVGKLCPQLQYIDLSGLCGITDAGLLPLLQNCEAGLLKVNLSGCLNLTNEIILALTKIHGATLEMLNLDGCRRITDASLVAIADNCVFLSDLDVSRCAITDAGVAALSHAEQLHLQVLSFSGCSGVTNKSLTFLKKLGKTLMGLNLLQCNSISTQTVDLLMESLWRCDILF